MLARAVRRRPHSIAQKRSYAKKPKPEPLRPPPVPAPNAAVRNNPNITRDNNYYDWMGTTQGTWLRAWIGVEPKQFVDDEGNIWRRSFAETRDARWLSNLRTKYLDENHEWIGASLPTTVENTPAYWHPYFQTYLAQGRLPFPNIEMMFQWAENMIDPAHWTAFREALQSGNINSTQLSRILGVNVTEMFDLAREGVQPEQLNKTLASISSLSKSEKAKIVSTLTKHSPEQEAALFEAYRKARIALEKELPGYLDARAQALNPNNVVSVDWAENEVEKRVARKMGDVWALRYATFFEHVEHYKKAFEEIKDVSMDIAKDVVRFMHLWNHLGIPAHAWLDAYPEIERLIEESSYDGSFDEITPGVKVNEPLERKWFAQNPLKLFSGDVKRALQQLKEKGISEKEFFELRKKFAYPLPPIRSEQDIQQDKLERALRNRGIDISDYHTAQRHLRKIGYDPVYRRAVEMLAEREKQQ